MTDPTADTAAQRRTIARAGALFRDGKLSRSWALTDSLAGAALPPDLAEARAVMELALAATGFGDARRLRALHAALPVGLRPDLRYRALLAHGLFAEAARLRRAGWAAAPRALRRDWRWSLSLALLGRGHLKAGLGLYWARFEAPNGGQSKLRAAIRYVPRQKRRLGTTALEQGLGDSALHLAHLLAAPGAAPRRFVASPRWHPVLQRLFPGVRTLAPGTSGAPDRPRANLSGDVLAEALERQGTLAPAARLADPVRTGPPVFGLLWRGGSGQNRVEERRLALNQLLDALPPNRIFVALQHDMTGAEKAMIRAHPQVRLPGFDLSDDLETLILDCIPALAGVIAVDGSVLHLAGLSDVPTLALMNPHPHWYWGRAGRAEALYPQARTRPIGPPDRRDLARWCRARAHDHAHRPAAPAPIAGRRFRRPVLVAGLPRSGTSMTTGMLAACGLWLGETVPGGPSNPKGFFESRALRDGLTKPFLKLWMKADPLGVDPLPAPGALPHAPHWHRRVAAVIAAEGYDGCRPWGYKDAKTTLIWPVWDEAFPEALWVVVRRRREDVIRSCLDTRFMGRRSQDPAFWNRFCDAYDARLAALVHAARGRVVEVVYEQVVAGRTGALEEVCALAGLEWSQARAARVLIPRT